MKNKLKSFSSCALSGQIKHIMYLINIIMYNNQTNFCNYSTKVSPNILNWVLNDFYCMNPGLAEMLNIPLHLKKRRHLGTNSGDSCKCSNTSFHFLSTRSFLGKFQVAPMNANRTSVSHHRVHCFLWAPLHRLSATSSAQHAVIEGQTHHGLLVAAVLPLDLPGLHAPQTSQVV